MNIAVQGIQFKFVFTQMRTDISVDSKQSHMTGVHFPLNDEALAKLADLKEHKLSLVQLVSKTTRACI